MKKKILVLSLFANMIAAFFVLTAFILKSKAVSDTGNSFAYMMVNDRVIVVDDKSTLSDIALLGGWTKEQNRKNYQTIAAAFKSLNSQGYQLVSSNGDHYESHYIFEKK